MIPDHHVQQGAFFIECEGSENVKNEADEQI
jgi:hypothetical protein